MTLLEIIFLFGILMMLIGRFYQLRYTTTDFDTFGHLYFSKRLKAERLGPFGPITSNVVASKAIPNPFFINWFFVHLFGIDLLTKINRSLNTLIDTFFSGVFFVILHLAGFRLQTILLALLIYLSTPLWTTLVISGPRLRSFTPRLLSEVLVMLYFTFIYVDIGLSEWQIIAITSAMSFAVLSSSKFGVQSILFTGLLCALIDLSLLPIIPLALSVLCLILFFRVPFLSSVKHHFNHLKWYANLNRKGLSYAANRSNLKGLWSKNRSMASNLQDLLMTKAKDKGPLAGSILISFTLPLIVLIFWDFQFFRSFEFSTPIMAVLLLFIVINIKFFTFLGESERYLSHVAILLTCGFSSIIQKYELIWVVAFLLIFNSLYFFNSIRILSKKVSAGKQTNDKITAFLGTLQPKVVLCFPYHVGSYFQILLETDHQLFGSILTDNEEHPITKKGLEPSYPYLDLDRLDEMSNDFGVNLLVLRKSALATAGFEGWNPPSEWQVIKTIGKGVMIYERNKDETDTFEKPG
ncbi:hypothetical protein [Roseivirga misakiensis]|uniref:Glycosyltransferase RgtA/B/C/D-like domain-containing protein n=1 Tax=Roseivirga misakiensis TaxID=1563681 RepID=A0A1E5T1G9_9BACT|nr:hypothetical protein [Roseivirga misakiensis]OEK05214.1 hypothetical protein BFP71_17580 [Roseivirga misakiensis]